MKINQMNLKSSD